VKIAIVQGTRPEIIKNYSIVRALQRARIPHVIFHTNQHVEPMMRDQIYAQMRYAPTYLLPAPYALGTAIGWLQAEYERQSITHVIVNGDTAAALVGAVSAMYSGIGVSHVEAGLRARDTVMLEERNRIMVDAVASLLFAYTDYERKMLDDCPDIRGRVFLEGNTTVDVLADFIDRIGIPPVALPYVLVTLHRREFTSSRERMQLVFAALSQIARNYRCRVILPLHPRTADAVDRAGLRGQLENLTVLPPLKPFDALSYQKHALVVMTDSGCVQEEAYLLGVPCVTIRDNTERHLTISHNANRLTGFEPRRILEAFEWAVDLEQKDWPEIYGKPGVGTRIVARILEDLSQVGVAARRAVSAERNSRLFRFPA
jgi:UDP-N-acetylglucosamine 2-epimerase